MVLFEVTLDSARVGQMESRSGLTGFEHQLSRRFDSDRSHKFTNDAKHWGAPKVKSSCSCLFT